MRIKALKVTNFKRLSELDIDTDRELVVLGGRNGAGKSSALDAISAALTGKGALPSEPIKRGEERSEIEVDLDEVVVKRTITRKDDGTYGGTLVIRTKDGMRPSGAQSWLDARIGNLSCDPLEFMGFKPAKQAEQLRDLAGVDTSDLDGKRRTLMDERRDVGRDGKRVAGSAATMPGYPGAPSEEVTPELASVSGLSSELEAARETERASAHAETMKVGSARSVKEEAEALDVAKAAVKRQQGELERARSYEEKMRTAAEVASKAVIDSAPIAARLAGAEEANTTARAGAEATNSQVRANRAKAAREEEAADLRESYKSMTQAIEAVDTERTALLAAADFPVDGLGFGDDGLVTYGGLPLEQASGAEKIRVSMAIALAGNPEIRVVLVRDAALLDGDSMDLIVSLASAADAQVWLERVGDADSGAIVIEDGGVINDRED